MTDPITIGSIGSTILGAVCKPLKWFISWVKVGRRKAKVKLREKEVLDREPKVTTLLQLEQAQFMFPSIHVKINIESIDLNGIKDAHKPIATIQFIIRNFLVRAIDFRQTEDVPCQIWYNHLDGRSENISDTIISVDRKRLEPCSVTAIFAKFKLPTLTRDELTKCSTSQTSARWDITPNWKFVIDDTTQEFGGWPGITFNRIPDVT